MSNTFWIGRSGALVALLLTSTPFALAQSTPAMEAWDANHDGVYTCDEWQRYLDRMFNLADRNHDGRLDPSEFATVRRAAPILADADFGYFDENQDGRITHEEFVGKPSEFILNHDRNGDCRVTPDEMKPAENTNAPKQPMRGHGH
ncbi:MAG TPA: EF-hand domain-containing protein [Bradyrhizobium sp.]|nr:EF-hand domain-containing protein [Bradyrhizobium sp.]